MTQNVTFSLNATDGRARTGVISTTRGAIRTPAFMPVGTAATVKAMMPESVAATGADILLGNTYHLMLRPTAERIDRLGGLHEHRRAMVRIAEDPRGLLRRDPELAALIGQRNVLRHANRLRRRLLRLAAAARSSESQGVLARSELGRRDVEDRLVRAVLGHHDAVDEQLDERRAAAIR